MSIQIKDLLAQVNKLERQIKTLNDKTQHFNLTNCYSKNRNFLNFSCVEKQKLNIDKVELIKDEDVLIECVVEINAMAAQEVEVGLVVADVVVLKTKKTLAIGTSQYSFSQNYIAPISGSVDIDILIYPLNMKQVLLQNCTLNIWGRVADKTKSRFDIIEVGDKYLISQLKNDCVFYKIIEKTVSEFNESDLDFCITAKDYSFIYDENKNIVFLFRIDGDKNLFIYNMTNGKTSFICSDISKISAVYEKDKIIAAIKKNEECLILTCKDESVFYISDISYKYIINDCQIFYNKFNGKFYLLLKLKNDKNILLESSDLESFGENLSVSYCIEVSCFEVKNEV